MLVISDLHFSLAGQPLFQGASATLPDGHKVGLVGRNGAGKTTLMRSIMGLARPRAGRIRFHGEDITDLLGHRRARMGIGYMPEDRRLVPELTVEENVLLPAWATGIEDVDERLASVYRVLPEVRDFAGRRSLQLSGGQQKLVALARALLAGRSLLLLDEPFEGVAPVLARRLVEAIGELKTMGLPILLSESDVVHSRDLVDRLFVIERGVVREVSKHSTEDVT